ncbi:MAG: hypothetical protein KDH96_08825 [Candidatus Riesia sp.]|nr:hypothetical protein [Candidatus Riesia sp.]
MKTETIDKNGHLHGLAKKARQGDQAAWSELITQLDESVLQKLVSQFYHPDGDTSDLRSTAYLGAYKAVLDWSEDKGKNLRSFVWMCVRRDLIDSIKKIQRKLKGNERPLSLDKETEGGALFQEVVAKESKPSVIPEKLISYLERATSADKKIIVDCIQYPEASHGERASRLGCTPKGVDNSLQRLRRRYHTSLNCK